MDEALARPALRWMRKSAKATKRVAELNKLENGLTYDVAGDTLIVKDEVIFTSVPLPEAWSLENDAFWQGLDSNAWATYAKLGALRVPLNA